MTIKLTLSDEAEQIAAIVEENRNLMNQSIQNRE